VSAVLWSNTLLLLVLLLLLLSASCLRISLSSYNASSSVCSCLLGLLINVPVDLEQTKLAPLKEQTHRHTQQQAAQEQHQQLVHAQRSSSMCLLDSNDCNTGW
jgi:hypothetical protein